MAGRVFTQIWRPYTPMGYHFAGEGADLRTSYTDGVDTRWGDRICIGPQRNTVDLSGVGGTPANANVSAIAFDSGGNPYIYIARGTVLAKLEPSDMSVITAGSPPTAVGARVTCLLPTRAPNGAWQLSEMDGTNTYKVRTAIANASEADTSSSNDQSSTMRLAYIADSDHNVYGVQNLSTTKGYTVRRNVLSTAKDMDNSKWEDMGSISAGATPTGLAITDGLLVVGTDKGPMLLDTDTAEWSAVVARVAQDSNNCRAMAFVDWLGVVMGVGNQIRIQRGANGMRIGPSTWPGNDTPIQGKLQGVAFDPDYVYIALRNAVASMTYFLAAKPSGGDATDLDWYCIGSQSDDCELMADWGTAEGDRTQPIFGGGKGSDIWYALKGRTTRWIEDSNYRYHTDTDFVWYGTELRLARPAAVIGYRWEGQSMSATQTAKLAVRSVGHGTTAATTTLSGAKITNGVEVVPSGLNNMPSGLRFRPQITLRTATASASPQIVGDLAITFQEVA